MGSLDTYTKIETKRRTDVISLNILEMIPTIKIVASFIPLKNKTDN
jgi:hypothetical protein